MKSFPPTPPPTRPLAVARAASISLAAALALGTAHAQFFNAAIAKERHEHGATSRMARMAIDAGSQHASADNGGYDPDVLFAGRMKVKYIKDYATKLGNGSGGIQFWRARAPAGYALVGDVMSSTDGDKATPVLVVEDNPDFVRQPDGFRLVWGDNWDNMNNATSTVWYPIAPAGYVALGMVAQSGNTTPDRNLYRCVKQDLAIAGKFDMIGVPFNGVGGTGFRYLWVGHYKVVPTDSTAVIAPNTLWFNWWDANHQPDHGHGWSLPNNDYVYPPRLANLARAGGEPNDGWIIGYLLRSATHDQVLKDASAGLAIAYKANLANTVAEKGAAALKNGSVRNASLDRLADEITRIQAAANAVKLAAVPRHPVPARVPPPAKSMPSAFSSFVAAPPALTAAAPAPRGPDRLGDIRLNGTSFGFNNVPGLDGIPAIKDAQITNARLIQGNINNGLSGQGGENGQPFAIVAGKITLTVSGIGQVSGDAYALTRLYKTEGVRSGLLVVVPADQLGRAIPDPIGRISVSHAAILFGSERHTWLTGDIAGSGIPADVSNALREFTTPASGLHFSKRLLVRLRANPGELHLGNMVSAVPPDFLFTALAPANAGESWKLTSEPLDSFKIGFLPPGLSLSAPRIEVVPAKTIGLVAEFATDIAGVKFATPLRIELGEVGSLTVSGNLPGEWRSPAGVPDLTLKAMTVDGTFGGFTPHMGIGGHASFLGKAANIAGTFAFSPTTLSGIRVDGFNVSLDDLITLENKLANVNANAGLHAQLPGNLIEIRNAAFSASSVDDPHLNIQRGTMVRGDLYLKGTPDAVAKVDALFDGRSNLQISADLKSFTLGPIEVGGPPHLDVLYTPSAAYNAAQHCIVRGSIKLPAATFATDVLLDRTSIQLNLNGQVADSSLILATYASGVLNEDGSVNTAKLEDMVIHGSFATDFDDKLERAVVDRAGNNEAVQTALQFLSGAIFKVRGVEVSSSYRALKNNDAVDVTVHCTIFGTHADPSFQLKLTEVRPEAFVEQLAQQVIKNVGDFSKVWDVAWQFIQGEATAAAKQVADSFVSASAKANDAVKESAAQVADVTVKAEEVAKKAIEAALDAIRNIGNKIKSFFGG